jgi:L-amino acid N-acyltransferase YncA
VSGAGLHIRTAHGLDARDMAAILSRLIAKGGTTAMTDAVDAAVIRDWMARGGARAAWHVAEDAKGALQGFQWIEPHDALPSEAAAIATFVDDGRQGLGVGSGLFRATQKAARALGYGWVSAAIRADNAGGLAYYQSRGFEDWGRRSGVRLGDGQVVDQVLKRFNLT